MSQVIPVILAGGAGTRLRPLTAPSRPKPFLKLFGRHSLLQWTALRVKDFRAPIVVTGKVYGERVLDELCAVGVQPSRIILEPAARSTAAAIAQAAVGLPEDAVMLVMPSDHYIRDIAVFREAALQAAEMALQDDRVVMIGAQAYKAADRYGYIQCADGGEILNFIEKPSVAEARALLKQGGVFWNTGIFAVKAGGLCDLLENYAPEILRACRAAHEGALESGVFYEPEYLAFSSAPCEAIDTALMEKIEGGRLVPLQTRWSDVGCWPALLKVKCARAFRRYA